MSNALNDENGGVREKALAAIQAAPAMVGNPAVEDGLRAVVRSENPRQKEIARSLLASRGRSSGVDAGKDLLDLAFFEAKVLPIFNAMADDGQNCVGCHRSHTVLRLLPPGKDGKFAPTTVRANYRAALGVVNLASPSDSLLLNKPTWDAAEEAEAQNDPIEEGPRRRHPLRRQDLARVPDDPRLDQRRQAPARAGLGLALERSTLFG